MGVLSLWSPASNGHVGASPGWCVPMPDQQTNGHNAHRLGVLVGRIADGDREAFRTLFAFMAMPVWGVSVHTLYCPIHALGVARSTFLEVWHMAHHHHGRDDIREWLADITRRRIADRNRLKHIDGFPAVFDTLAHRELDKLIGPSPMLVRVAPRVYTRAEGADGALIAVADPWPTRQPAAPWRLARRYHPW